jgi:hypothetical protein
VAQLVARVLWEHEAAGSSPVIPTKYTGAYKYAPVAFFGVCKPARHSLCNFTNSKRKAGIYPVFFFLSSFRKIIIAVDFGSRRTGSSITGAKTQECLL